MRGTKYVRKPNAGATDVLSLTRDLASFASICAFLATATVWIAAL